MARCGRPVDSAAAVRRDARSQAASGRGASDGRDVPGRTETLLERRLAEVAANAAADKLQDIRVQGGELKITQLKAATPEQAEELADRLYAMLPNVRITALWPTPPISGLRGRRVRGR